MAWIPLNQLTLTDVWQFTDETESEFFQIRHSNIGSVARALVCQGTIINEQMFLYQIREMSANQNEIWKIEKPPIFDNRRLGFCQIYGETDWSIQVEEFMGINNPGSVSVTNNNFATATNASVAYTANTGVVVLPANPNRKYAAFVNNSATEATLTLGGTSAANPIVSGSTATGVTIGSGIPLVGKGGSYEIKPENLYTGIVSIISASAGSLSVVEG